MTEIKDADELYRFLGTRSRLQHAVWAWWAPGDFTRYRVIFTVAPYITGNAFYMLLTFEVGEFDRITLSNRSSRGQLWTAESFLATFGEKYAGWWAGIRPVLAAFKWTSSRADDLAYSSRDAEEIGALL